MSATTKHDPIPGLVLNSPNLRDAVKKVPNLPVLINAVSQRVRQLNSGHRAMVKLEGEPSKTEIALAEIARGLLEVIQEEPEVFGDFL
ncbi:MAG: DNA-directed RNA polymerase subunit omega [Verrucomicrobiota bacterium]|nr:DNA-directed RNA polymerase subunit omega [Verrucomicrobiota bacterium]